MNIKILGMEKKELSKLQTQNITRGLTPEEVVHMARTLGAFWTYDYEAASQGKVGMHAILKSGLHSDGFFISRILLAPENIRRIISAQITMKLRIALRGVKMPDYVAGVPDGATQLGEDISEMLGAKNAKMKKIDGQISLITPLGPEKSILFVEDFCTRGTGFTEAVRGAQKKYPFAQILPFNPVIINRGGLEKIVIEEIGEFKVLPVVEWKINDWDPAKECPLCKMKSVPIKPKATDENWETITNSQKE